MRFAVLGTLEVSGAGPGDAPALLRSGKLRRLLAALLVETGEVVSVDRLADILWSDDPPADAPRAVHNLVSRLRGWLRDIEAGGEALLLTRPPGDAMGVERDQLDAARFEDLLVAARGLLTERPEKAADLLDEALGLWRGPAYAEFAEEEFARAEAARLEELRLTAMEERLDAALALGHHHQVGGQAEALVAAQPLRERPLGQLMLALYRSGRAADALEAYRAYRQRLSQELGLEPSPALVRLEAAVLRQDPNLDLQPPPSPPTPVGVGPPETSPPTTTSADEGRPGNLPQPRTPLIGREEDLAGVVGAMSRWRVVTLIGVGGVGKTRLALHAARDAGVDYRDGVWLCELAALADPAEVDGAVATVLRVQPRQGLSTLERLVEFLRPKRALVVVDNCEHVLEAAARLIDKLTSGCPQVSVLATSREPLRIEGEYVRPVPPLTLPAPSGDAVSQRSAASVELFRQRAEAARPDFVLTEENLEVVGEICRRLDGLPLAIELAASRLRSMTPPEIAQRLDTRFRLLHSGRRVAAARQRSLRSLLDWSYGLLTETEQRTFERLSVFAGDFSLIAAEQVAVGLDLDQADVADAVGGLVDKSMLVAREQGRSMRYSLLETLRDYARERLHEHGSSEEVRYRHAAYYVSFSEQADQGLRGPDEARWVQAVNRELDNLRAAHAWALAAGQINLALRLSAALAWYAQWRPASELFTWANNTAQAAAVAEHRSALLPMVWASAAAGARNRGDFIRAAALAQEGLTSSQAPYDPQRRYPLVELGNLALFRGRLDEAALLYEEAAALSHEADDLPSAACALSAQSMGHAYRGAVEVAVRLTEQATRLAEATANPSAKAFARYAAGEALLETDPHRAFAMLDESIRLGRSVQNDFLVGVALVSAASLRGRRGQTHEALSLFREVIEYWHRVGNWTQQRTTLRNFVELLTRLRRDKDAATLYGALTAAHNPAALFGAEAERLAAARHTLETQLGLDGFARAVAEGATLDDQEAVVLACAAIDRTLVSSPRSPSEGEMDIHSEFAVDPRGYR